MHKSKPHHSYPGYTLAELYICMAILAFLFVIVTPIFTKDSRRPRQTTCISNSKQIGLALLQYVQDYDETFPSGLSFPTKSSVKTPGMGWAGESYPYMKTETVYHCPDDPTKDLPAGDGHAKRFVCSYLFNANLAAVSLADLYAPASTVLGCEGLGNQIQFATGWEGHHMGKPHPADRFSASTDGRNYIYYEPDGQFDGSVLLDTGIPGGYADHTRYADPSISTQHIWFVREGLGGRHTDGSIYMVGDGHVKWLKPDAVSVGQLAASSSSGPIYPGVAAGTEVRTFQLTFSPR